jgi:dTDP-4-amino-4,6-dideoxygalactose transaminase
LHLQKPYAFLNYTREDLPVASHLAAEIVSLPMFPQLTTQQQAKVAKEILAFTSGEPREEAADKEGAKTQAKQLA